MPGQTHPRRRAVPSQRRGDGQTRLAAARLAEQFGQPVIVENKPGANGAIGTAEVARAPAGVGSLSHLLGEMPNATTGTNFTHVPYKGVSQIVVALLSNEVAYSFVIGSAAMGQFKTSKLRPIAVLGTSRSSSMPDVPTMQEAGLDGFSLNTWFGFMAPAATPGPVIDALHGQLAKILNEPEIRNKLEQVAAEPWPATPDEFAAVLRAEASLYEAAARNAGIATR